MIFAPCSSWRMFAQTLPALPNPWTATVPPFILRPGIRATYRMT